MFGWNKKQKETPAPEPVKPNPVPNAIVIFPDSLEIFVTGNHDPQKLAECLYLFSTGEMSETLTNALLVNGCALDNEWKKTYETTVQHLLKKEKEMKDRPVISSLQAFR